MKFLEFKSRRKAELEALHSYCDELYFSIIESGDPNLKSAKVFNQLSKAIDDLNKLNSEGWRSPIRFDLDISPEFDLGTVIAGASTAIAALNSPNPFAAITAGTVVTLLAGCVKVKASLQSVKSPGNKNLAYLSRARREGLIT